MRTVRLAVVGLFIAGAGLSVVQSAQGLTSTFALKYTATPTPTRAVVLFNAVSTPTPSPTRTPTLALQDFPYAGNTQTFARIFTTVSSARSGPDTSYERVIDVYFGDLFPVVDQSGTPDNLWFMITLPDGTQAWVWDGVVELLNAAGEPVVPPTPTLTAFTPDWTATAVFRALDAIADTQTALAPTITPLLPTNTIQPRASATPTEPLSSLPFAEGANTFARVILNTTRARVGPGANFEAVETLQFNQRFPILDQSGTATNNLWLLIVLPDGRALWVSTMAVEILDSGGERIDIATPTHDPGTPTVMPSYTRTPRPTSTPLPTRTPRPSATPSPVIIEADLYIRVTTPNVNARLGPGTEFAVIDTLAINVVLPVITQSGEGSNRWYLVWLPNGQTGWVWGPATTAIPAEELTPTREAAATDINPPPRGTIRPPVRPTRQPSATASPEVDVTFVHYGDVIHGRLEANGLLSFVLFASENDTVAISLESDDFRPVVLIADEDGNDLVFQGGWETRTGNIYIEYTFEADGVYFILAGGEYPTDRGRYTLTVERILGK